MPSSAESLQRPYMLLFRNAGPETHNHLSVAERTALTKQWNDWYDRLAKAGKVQHGQPLALEGRVIASVNGRLTDGPYAESKEAIGGYFIINAVDLAEAAEIAKGCPGLPIGVVVEVRPLAGVSPVLNEVIARPPA